MNFYKARERHVDAKPTGVWDYTCHNDNHRGTYPIGYCAGWQEHTKEELKAKWGESWEMFWKNQEELRVFKHLFHDDGHKSADEACKCYRSYLINHCRSELLTPDFYSPCVVCARLTNRRIGVNGVTNFAICKEGNHDIVKEITARFQVGESFGSM